jgi:hypothetical protein
MKKVIFSLAGIGLLLASSCKKDEGKKVDTYTIPTTYNFENVNYSGQTARLGMLLELSTYAKSANIAGVVLDAEKMRAMFSNTTMAGFAGSYPSDKQLKDKTISTEQTLFEGLMDDLSIISSSTDTASNGKAGRAVSVAGKSYLLTNGGAEIGQIIEKGLMGALLYYQATAVYLADGKMNVDNETVTPGEGTVMQHHWDEAFGYLGVPIDFPSNTTGTFFWGNYSNNRNEILGSNATLMNAFLKGRAAIGAKKIEDRDAAINAIRIEWQRVCIGSALHYLNGAYDSYDTDKAAFFHEISEGLAFVYALKFNPKASLSQAQIDAYITQLAGTTDLRKLNFYNLTKSEINTIRTNLANDFNLSGLLSAF